MNISYLNILTLVLLLVKGYSYVHQWVVKYPSTLLRPSRLVLHDIPLELEGKLDATKHWDVKFIFDGEERTVKVSEDTSLLDMGESLFDGVDSTCRNGICLTCAGQVLDGKENTVLAKCDLTEEQVDAGFVCTCQCYVAGPGVVVQLGTYDQVCGD